MGVGKERGKGRRERIGGEKERETGGEGWKEGMGKEGKGEREEDGRSEGERGIIITRSMRYM